MPNHDLTSSHGSLSGQTNGIVGQLISSDEPISFSPWWLRGTAISIIIITLLTLLNVLIAEITLQFASDSILTIKSEMGGFPANGSASEQRQWNDTKDAILWMEATQGMFEDPRMQQMLKVQRIGALFSLLVASVSVFFLLNQDRKGLGFAALWIFIGFLIQSYSVFISSTLSVEYFGGLYVNKLAWIQSVQTYGGYVQMVMCNLSLVAILTIVWTKTKLNSIELKSAFHIKPN